LSLPLSTATPTTTATKVHVISHTHWDREWYLTREDYRLRLIDLVDGVLDRMDRDDAFTFFHLDGQTIVLEDYLQVRPDQEPRLRRRIGEGRLLVGPWYVMPDMFLVSGEALVRNLALGHKIAESFGRVMQAGYTPDPFGHVAQMPQILAGFGLDNAILWRGFGGPRSEYWWEGHDGTRTLLLHFPREGYCNAFRLPLLPPSRRSQEAAAVVAREDARSSVGSALLMAGIDHTEPHPELLTLIGEMNAADGVSASLSTLPAYVDQVRKAVIDRELALEVVRGELRAGEDYSNLLPGVLSARTYLKKSNVRAQALLEKVVEPLALFAWLAGETHPGGVIAYAWKTLIENHPHDSICGCSIDEVHDENDTRFARVLQVADGLAKRSLRAVARRIEPAPEGSIRFVVVNTDIHPQAGVFEAVIDLPIESAEPGRMLDSDLFDAPLSFFPRGSSILAITDPSGAEVPFQELWRESRIEQWTSRVELPLAVHVERLHVVCSATLPSTGFVALDARIGQNTPLAAAVESEASRRTIENDVLRLDVNDDGTLNVHDKRSGSTYRHVLEIEDQGDVGDEYNYSPPAKDRRITSRGGSGAVVSLLARGALRSALRIETGFEVPTSAAADRASRAATNARIRYAIDVELTQGSPVVSCRIRVHNEASDHRLRVLFPTGARTVTESRADTAFGIVSRAAQRDAAAASIPEAPVNSAPLQSVVDAGDAAVGMTVLSEGLMEYEVMPFAEEAGGPTIALTVLRSVGWLSREDLQTRKGNAGPSLETPGAQCVGDYEFRFAFAPRSAPPSESALCDLGRRFLAPPSVVAGTNGPKAGGGLPRSQSFITTTADGSTGAALSALKKAEDRDGVVIRLFNPAASSVQLGLSMPLPPAGAFRLNLREQRQESLPIAKGSATLSLGPRKIVTVELTPKD
jgi:mannosylglycerate hydrolase